MKQSIVLVGGYLGAGKTTLLLKAAEILEGRGLRAVLILNDQGEDLVDTRLAEHIGREVRDATGSCFCCNLPDFLDAVRAFPEADVILAEPVGSCTDIVRTVLHPLQEAGGHWRVAPFTVLVDPERAATLAAGESDLSYLFNMQLAEADLVVASKADRAESCCVPVAAFVSGKSGAGVSEWLDLVLNSSVTAATRRVTVDYARYGAAEASLAWLNWSATATCAVPVGPLRLIGPFVDAIREGLGTALVHLKLLDSGPDGYLRVSACDPTGEVALEGTVIGDPQLRHRLVLNLRAECTPERVETLLRSALSTLPAHVDVECLQCFRPAPPFPTVDLSPRS